MSIKTFSVQRKKIRIHCTSEVFSPSTLALLFARNIKIKKSERVFDCGYGTGFLGILAGKLGASYVTGSEINKESISLARKNAELNGIVFHPLLGSLFSGTKEKFDVIIANLPQGIAPTKMKKSEMQKISIEPNKGNRTLLNFLKQAKSHLNKNGRIYAAICYVQDYRKVLDLINKNYKMKVIANRKCPLPQMMKSPFPESIKQYERLQAQGKIKLKDELIELRLK